MKAIADVCVVPIGVGVSVSEYVVGWEKMCREAGLDPRLHAYGTNVEGEWDDVMAAVRRCHERIHDMGAPRVSTSIRIGTRTDRVQTMQDKIESVTSKLAD